MAWFTSDFNQFFIDLAPNNNKEWFDANRRRYENNVKEPFEAFVAEVIQRVAKVDTPVMITPREATITPRVRSPAEKAVMGAVAPRSAGVSGTP